MIVLSEFMRRMKEMNHIMNRSAEGNDMFNEHTLVLNSNNPVIKSIVKLNENSENEEKVKQNINHIYDLALLAQNQLEGDRLVEFIKRSGDLIK